jgi:hypothetical protein
MHRVLPHNASPSESPPIPHPINHVTANSDKHSLFHSLPAFVFASRIGAVRGWAHGEQFCVLHPRTRAPPLSRSPTPCDKFLRRISYQKQPTIITIISNRIIPSEFHVMLSCSDCIRPVTGNLVTRRLIAKGIDTPPYGQLKRRLLLMGIVTSPNAREFLAEHSSIQPSSLLLSPSLREPCFFVINLPYLNKFRIDPNLSFVDP